MHKKLKIERKNLTYSLLAGISAAGSWFALFSGHVQFSIFPLLTCAVSLYALYDLYIEQAIEKGMGTQLFASFFIGFAGYVSYIKVTNPELGNNFVYILLALAAMTWLGAKRGAFISKTPSTSENEETKAE